jgi:division protein CdvB (Snf7/Vps24/ESCRT-III family)
MDDGSLAYKIYQHMGYWGEELLTILIDSLVNMKNLEPRLKSILPKLQARGAEHAERFINLLRSKVPAGLIISLEEEIKAIPRISEHFESSQYAKAFVVLSSHESLIDTFTSEIHALRYLDHKALVTTMQTLLTQESLTSAKTYIKCLEDVICPHVETIEECKNLLALKSASKTITF